MTHLETSILSPVTKSRNIIAANDLRLAKTVATTALAIVLAAILGGFAVGFAIEGVQWLLQQAESFFDGVRQMMVTPRAW